MKATSWRLISINSIFIFLGLAVCIFWIYLSGGGELVKGLTEVPSGIIILLPVITAFWIFARFIRWQFILRRVNVRVPIRGGLSIYLASLPGIATPAYIGEVIRSVFMKQKFGIPLRITIWALVIERLLDFSALGIIALVTSNYFWSRYWVFLLIGLGVLFFLGGSILPKNVSVPQKRTLVMLQNGNRVFQALVLSLLIWLPASFLIPLAANSINVEVPPIMGMHIYSTSTVLGGITLMPAGFGATGSLGILQLQSNGIPITSAIVIISIVRLMSTGISLAVGTLFLFRQLRQDGKEKIEDASIHFNEIAREYEEQWSAHVWNYLLERKLRLISSALSNSPTQSGVGLDLGCGLGIQCREMNRRGYKVIGLDPAYGLIRQGKTPGVSLLTGDALKLPFGDASFDYVYVIGVLHHLPGIEAQMMACKEVVRILKPGGLFIIHETNPNNLLFRFYMGYIFPILKSIDEGTEWWIEPARWNSLDGVHLTSLQYFTFLPDFIPHFLMKLAIVIERKFETSFLRPYSVHYIAVVQKEEIHPFIQTSTTGHYEPVRTIDIDD